MALINSQLLVKVRISCKPNKKNPAYGRHQLSGLIQILRGCVIYLKQEQKINKKNWEVGTLFFFLGGGVAWPMRGWDLIMWSEGQWEVGCKVNLESFEASDITIACNLLCLAQGLSQLGI